MYRIKTTDKTLYTDAIRHIRLHKNGCYVACLEDVAEGICAKVHEDREEIGTVLDDTVFALYEGGMNGTEPVCVSIEKDYEATVEDLYHGQHAQDVLAILIQAGVITEQQAASYREIIEAVMQAVEDEVALTAVPLFPEWKEGMDYQDGTRVKRNDFLYRVREGKAHTSQVGWEPEVATSLWEAVNVDNEGTASDAIPYTAGMALEEGKHYTEGGVTYLCTRESGAPVYHALKDLVGLYVEVVP